MTLKEKLLTIFDHSPLPAGFKIRLRTAIRNIKVKSRSISSRVSVFIHRRIIRKVERTAYTISQWIQGYPNERKIFFANHGYPLNLKNPQAFTEKIVWKKIYDRNPLLPRVTDKFLVRDYIREKIGPEKANDILIPLLFSGKDPAAIPFGQLPDQFVIKPNHASGLILIVRDKHQVDPNVIIPTCRNWLTDTYCFYRHEWAYQKIKPMILVEPLLLGADGNVPREIKFHVFHGKCKRVVVIVGRYADLKQSNFDENWNYIETEASYPMGPPLPKPANFQQMLSLAEKLAEDFDYIRVDLFDLDGRIYFSELTNYTNSGDVKYKPIEYDFEIGANWKIVPGYWKK